MGMHLWGGRPGAVSKRIFSLVRVVAARIIGASPCALRAGASGRGSVPCHPV